MRKGKHLCTVGILLALLVVLSACQPAPAAPTPAPATAAPAAAATPVPATAAPAATPAAAATAAPASQPPATTPKWKGKISVATYFFSPIENDKTTPVLEEALKAYGYDVTLEPVFLDNSKYLELLTLRIASGDAPDVFQSQSADNVSMLYKQGAIATWDEAFFREHAPVSAKFFDEGGPAEMNKDFTQIAWTMSKIDGKMVGVPSLAINTGAPLIPIYNTKWLEKLGVKEPPRTMEDFTALMYRFTKEDPDGNGKDDTYGLSSTMLGPVFGAYGSFPGFLWMDKGHFYDVGGSLVAADIMPGNKDALAVIAQYYKDKVLDPEFVTGENQGGYWAISHAFINNRIGVTYNSGIGHYQWTGMYPELTSDGAVMKEFRAINGPDAKVTWGFYPKGPGGDMGGFKRLSVNWSQGIIYNASLMKDQAKLAAIFEIMDIFAKDEALDRRAINGVEGQDYTLQTGGWIKATDGFDNVARNKVGLMGVRSLYGPENPFNQEYFARSLASPGTKYTTGLYGSDPQYSAAYISKLYDALPSAQEYANELYTFRDETWLKIIQGALPLDAYDKYVTDWKARGGQKLTDEANDWYQTHKW